MPKIAEGVHGALSFFTDLRTAAVVIPLTNEEVQQLYNAVDDYVGSEFAFGTGEDMYRPEVVPLRDKLRLAVQEANS